ncbi:MAG: homocysteine S-methyltransferase family protein [Planctomycetes bacterium]|nr:homocysteine S-methyltransferase family protein [Planctomycetota bacterium]
MTQLDELFPGSAPVLLDAAMGSRLRDEGWPADRPTVLANLDAPQLVTRVHAAHREAGAQILMTNTFSALLLSDTRCREAVSAGVRLARAAAGESLRVAASVAAFGLAVGDPQLEGVVEQLVDEGVDLIVFETCTKPRDATSALDLLERRAPDLPGVICASSTDGGHDDVDRVHAVLEIVHAAALPGVSSGLNCCRGPQEVLKLAQGAPAPLRWLKPNTGDAREHSDDNVMAGFARAATQHGARFVGACCGSSPETLSAMRSALSR